MLNFTQEEVERELADKMPHGHRHKIAAKSGLGESYLKRQFNPDDETVSCAFRLLQVACAFDEIDAGLGEQFWQTLVRFRELSKPADPALASCLNTETGKLNKEIAEFITSKFEGKPLEEQYKELLDAETQLAEVKRQLHIEYDRIKRAGDISIN